MAEIKITVHPQKREDVNVTKKAMISKQLQLKAAVNVAI